MTPPTSSTSASTTSTVPFSTDCSTVTAAATKMIWNNEVPGTTRRRHAENVDHRRHHDEAAADAAHDRRQHADA